MPRDKQIIGLDLVRKNWNVACLQGWGSSQEQQPPQVLGIDLYNIYTCVNTLNNPLNNLGSSSISEKYETSSIV